MVRRDPQQYGGECSRWRSADVRQVCDWLRLGTAGGLSQLFRRLDISYKRGREHVHSPDPDYVGKLYEIHGHLEEILRGQDEAVLLFQDECSYHRRPSLARAYASSGHEQPLAELGLRTNSRQRIIGVLHPFSGAVYAEQHYRTGIKEITTFYQHVCQLYPQARVIYLVQDNWPMHLHPDVLAALQPQQIRWPYRLPARWSKITPRPWTGPPLPMQLLLLPTYASWTNPIEKLWRLLRQEVLHLHRFQDDWKGLQERVGAFLQQFAQGSAKLLRYVGLSVPQKLYSTAFTPPRPQPALRC